MKSALLLLAFSSALFANTRLASNPYHFCLQDDEGVKCWESGDIYESNQGDVADFSLPQSHPCHQRDDRDSAECKRYRDGFGQPKPGAAESKVPGGIQCDAGRACLWAKSELNLCEVNAAGIIECTQNYYTPGDEPADLEAPHQNYQPAKFRVPPHGIKQIVMTYDQVCALDEAGVECAYLESHAPPLSELGMKYPPPVPSFGQPRELAASRSTVCGLSLTELYCQDVFHREEEKPPVTIVLGDAFFRLENLRDLFDWLKDKSYRKHGFVYEAAQTAYAEATDQNARLLLLNAIAPFTRRIDSDYYKKEVIPRFDRWLPIRNQEAGIHALTEIPCSPGYEHVALQLLSGALRELAAEVPTAEWLKDLLTANGRALAASNEVADLRRTLRADQARLTELGSSQAGPVDLVTTLQAYVDHCAGNLSAKR